MRSPRPSAASQRSATCVPCGPAACRSSAPWAMFSAPPGNPASAWRAGSQLKLRQAASQSRRCGVTASACTGLWMRGCARSSVRSLVGSPVCCPCGRKSGVMAFVPSGGGRRGSETTPREAGQPVALKARAGRPAAVDTSQRGRAAVPCSAGPAGVPSRPAHPACMNRKPSPTRQRTCSPPSSGMKRTWPSPCLSTSVS